MKREEFRRWLSSRGLSEKSVSNYVSECQWVNNYVGDLDEAFETDRCESMLRGISFGGKAGDLVAIIDGDPASNFATYRTAVRRYVEFRRCKPRPCTGGSTSSTK